MARPIPRVLPVTTATLPANDITHLLESEKKHKGKITDGPGWIKGFGHREWVLWYYGQVEIFKKESGGFEGDKLSDWRNAGCV
jgi:hypothetical protein